MDSSAERAQRIAQKLASYYVLFQTCADKVRHIVATEIYDEALKKWQDDPSNPIDAPPRGDEEKKASYMAKCDEICRLEPKTAHEYGISGKSANATELTR
jgi:hypothetical protein